jgi:tetratricopeptide (TPR) repeat protein/DNA-binding XRE family transcriptional regulator
VQLRCNWSEGTPAHGLTPGIVDMPIVEQWTGREAKALREALRMGTQTFADHLGVSKRSIINWESKGNLARPRPEMQSALDTALRRLETDAVRRFESLLQDPEFQSAHRVSTAMSDDGEDKIIISCRMADGGIIQVAVPRRTLFVGAFGAAALVASTGTARPTQRRSPNIAFEDIPGDLHPVDRFRRVRGVLVDQDNLVGAGYVLPAVRQQIDLIQQMRYEREGKDSRALLHVQAEYAEFAGWLCQDLGDFDGARRALSDALEQAHAVGDVELVTYILARMSQLAGDMNDPMAAIDMAEAARISAGGRHRLGAASATYGAYGHALEGNELRCRYAIEDALERIEDAKRQDLTKWATWLDRAYVQVQNGRCLTQLKKYPKAIIAFQKALDALPADYRRDRGVYLARQAFAHVKAGSVDQAAAGGRQAVDIAFATGSQRIISELGRLDAELDRWSRTPAVRDFREALECVVVQEA